MDDLFIAAFQRREDEHPARFAGAAASATKAVPVRKFNREIQMPKISERELVPMPIAFDAARAAQ